MNNGSNGGVELFFEFHTPREFTSLTLHLARGVATSDSTNNNKTKRGLTGCLVNFAVTRGNHLGKVVRFVHDEEQETSSIYNVTVDLKRRIGRFLKLELQFNSQWLLMSEVTFQSTLHDPNVTSTQQQQQQQDDDDDDAVDAHRKPSEGPEIPIIDDGSSNMDDEDDDDIFEEISTVAEDQRTAYIGLVGGVLSIVVLLLGTGLIVYLKRRKNRHGKQVAAILPGGGGGGGNGLSGDGLNKMSLTPRTLNLNDNKQRMTLLSLKQLGGGGGHKNANSNLAPSARDGFYGPVISSMGESDSDTSSFYHEPYQQQQQPLTIKYSAGRNGGGFQRNYSTAAAADPEYTKCLIQKEPLLLTPKGLHSKGLFHHSNSTSMSTLASSANKSGHNSGGGGGHSSYTAIPLPRPPLSAVKQSLLLVDNPSNTVTSTTTSFTALPSENYYATTDLILVSFVISLSIYCNSF